MSSIPWLPKGIGHEAAVLGAPPRDRGGPGGLGWKGRSPVEGSPLEPANPSCDLLLHTQQEVTIAPSSNPSSCSPLSWTRGASTGE